MTSIFEVFFQDALGRKVVLTDEHGRNPFADGDGNALSLKIRVTRAAECCQLIETAQIFNRRKAASGLPKFGLYSESQVFYHGVTIEGIAQ
jgi:hypothetical protein